MHAWIFLASIEIIYRPRQICPSLEISSLIIGYTDAIPYAVIFLSREIAAPLVGRCTKAAVQPHHQGISMGWNWLNIYHIVIIIWWFENHYILQGWRRFCAKSEILVVRRRPWVGLGFVKIYHCILLYLWYLIIIDRKWSYSGAKRCSWCRCVGKRHRHWQRELFSLRGPGVGRDCSIIIAGS